MSETFIEYVFPCKDCIVRAACSKSTTPESIQRNGLSLAIPVFEQGKTYHKGIMECWANLGKKILDKVSKTENSDGKQRDNLPIKYVFLLAQMTNIICYTINSTSWREGQVYQFDRDEIRKNLNILSRML